ncbi:MAG: EAL domain-containing protein [Bauldia sp.]
MRLRRAVAAALIILVALAAHWGGLLRPLNHALTSLRMYSEPRQPTGDVVVVDIDAKSIATIGSWPWPRRLHAELIDRLVELGASDIAFDIDFSAATNPTDDAALEAAIARAAGKITLAAFVQKQTTGADSAVAFNRPLARFAKNAWMGSVNVRQDSDGIVRQFGYGLILDGKVIPSIPSILAGGISRTGREFSIDFSIDTRAIDRISLIDVLRGTVDPQRLAGKKVIVGAQAVELRDFFNVPVAGTISGAMLQAAATETLLQGRALEPSSVWVEVAGLMLIALAVLAIGRVRWSTMVAALIAIAALTEAAAAMIQKEYAFATNTAPWHVAFATFAIAVLVSEIDIRELLQNMWRLRASNAEALLTKVVADNFAGVVVVDETGIVRAASRSASELLNLRRSLIGAAAREVLPPELMAGIDAVMAVPEFDRVSRRPSVTVLTRRDGQERAIEHVTTVSEVESVPAEGGGLRRQRVATVTFTDVTEQRAAEAQIAYMARFDALTELPNRNLVIERLEDVFASKDTAVRASAVVCLDLDGFKNVNDSLGHQTGDLLLQAVAQKATAILPHGAMVARLGGDEFAAIFSGKTASEDAVEFATRAVHKVNLPFDIAGHRILISASAGVALADARDRGPDDILKRADVALSRAKANGGNGVAIFERRMLEAVVERQKLELDLWQALEREEFEVWYQPQVELRTGRVAGVEALLRWRHPDRGLVMPGDFIPVAEAIGLIDELGQWVLETACAEVATWPADVRLAVNVSSAQFARCDMAALVASALEKGNLPASRLDLEITESVFLQPSSTLHDVLTSLRSMGVGIALDDFGTGYSSLGYLQKFPITKIKLDRQFVADLPANAGSAAIVRAVASLARELKLQLNAEGVEMVAQVAFLNAYGIDEVQGYLYGRPAPARDIIGTLEPSTEGVARLRA